jgi:hypothetical protein
MRPVNGDVLARYDAVPVTAAGRKGRMIRAFPRRTVLGVGLSCGYAVTDVAMGALGVREDADERAVHDEPGRLDLILRNLVLRNVPTGTFFPFLSCRLGRATSPGLLSRSAEAGG